MKFIIVFFLALIYLGCKDLSNDSAKNLSPKKEKDKHGFDYRIDFPDTLYLNKLYDGEIYYESPMDTIIKKFFNPEEDRYVVFRCPPGNGYTFRQKSYIDSIGEYRFGAVNNRTIPIYDLIFSKTGNYKISGFVNDLVLLNPETKYNKDEEKIRLIERDFPITLNIVVIDSVDINH